MNERQLILFMRQANRAERLGDDVWRAVAPLLQQSFDQIIPIIEALPEDDILRKLLWNRSLPEVARAFGPYSAGMEIELVGQMAEQAPQTADEAAAILNASGSDLQITPQQVPQSVRIAAARNTTFADQKLVNLFDGPFVAQNVREINTRVQRGILEGLTTADIAKDVQQISPGVLRRQADAIARTSVQSYNTAINNEVWTDNYEQAGIDGWEWVAVLDSRACQVCAPLDGQIKKKRSDFPTPPVHVSCRCQVMPWWEDEDVLERSGQVISETPYKGDRAYKTKVKVDGELYYRKAVNVKSTVPGQRANYADFMAYSSNQTTREAFFGSKARAARFHDLVHVQQMDPSKALLQTLKKAPSS